MVVNTGKTQLFERQVAKFFDRLFDVELSVFNMF
jgi:hypothetical protein